MTPPAILTQALALEMTQADLSQTLSANRDEQAAFNSELREPELGFGPHLMLDCRQCDISKISDLQHVFTVLDQLPELIGMTKITAPYVFNYSGLIPEDRGITGTVIIAESHITFHSFIEKDYFFFDIFSCKPFNVERVVEYIVSAFGVRSFERADVARGRFFPRGNIMARGTGDKLSQAEISDLARWHDNATHPHAGVAAP
ncbi:MAG: S-adenosylmethionine decarboxylase [Vampirovibrionales bacterium]|nr:S-adenosylmethionine decarboxylase [Vampirovibrionales bacterium]